jgi:hypothetical protein
MRTSVVGEIRDVVQNNAAGQAEYIIDSGEAGTRECPATVPKVSAGRGQVKRGKKHSIHKRRRYPQYQPRRAWFNNSRQDSIWPHVTVVDARHEPARISAGPLNLCPAWKRGVGSKSDISERSGHQLEGFSSLNFWTIGAGLNPSC